MKLYKIALENKSRRGGNNRISFSTIYIIKSRMNKTNTHEEIRDHPTYVIYF